MYPLFDANTRPLVPALAYNEDRTLSTREQAIAVAIPILSLFGPTSMMLMAGVGMQQVYDTFYSYRDAQNKGDETQLWNAKKQFLWQMSVGIMVCVNPVLYTIINTMVILKTYKEQMQQTEENGERAKIALGMLHEVIYCGSIAIATPELLAISLIAQAALEAYRARRDYQNKNYIKFIGTIALSILRLHQAMPHLETLKNKYCPDDAPLFALAAHTPGRKRIQMSI